MSSDGSTTQPPARRQFVVLPSGTVFTARMPTPGERRRLKIAADVPVLDVGDRVLPADRYCVKVAD